ncbi:sigma-70 family RNA polymerase sigma factor [Streptomyces sp. H27-S2]|uniref:sigma-70 family RNA polymerase sigma factor n=1 Tax=Streptomyces antarcticus TaxID=2996458 RepID=UPI00226F91A1|nr:sigma-70 family RNA polymerase sigma factor [Streptomyces sp. H27-S2]MCY0949483.1 sigma-70 family RNA polymerase sigma factor [Streptomyces sp. H27-S2]
MSTQHTAALVAAARAGDPRAQDELVSTHLPLVYNIVGRALNGSCDVDDVVQDTMLRALDGLGGLRADDSFRSWLVAIAMNRVRAFWQARQNGLGASGLEATEDVADPGADFVDLTVARLNLAGQRRETARATRWLEPDDRALLSLWWLECAGELTRAEVATALELPPQHTGVRVQRMKAQLEAARVVERALDAQPPCEGLRQVTAGWDGAPSALWRKRIARHARECVRCSGLWSGLVPAEGLLAGLSLVPVSAALLAGMRTAGAAGFDPAGAAFADGSGADFTHGSGTDSAQGSGAEFANAASQLTPTVSGPGRAARRRSGGQGVPGAGGHAGGAAAGHASRGALRKRRRSRRRVIGGAVIAACVAGGGLAYLGTLPGSGKPEAGGSTSPAPLAALSATDPGAPLPSASASPSPSQSPSPSPSASASASASASPSTAPSPSASPTPQKSRSSAPAPKPSAPAPAPAPPGVAGQVVALVNKERATAGCGPLKDDAQLRAAAQGHSEDMAKRDFFSHTSPDGADPGKRTTAAGYRWSTYGENIAKGQQTAQSVMESWMNSSGHRANILNCAFKDIGVGVHQGAGGPWWTQNFGAR